MKAYNEGGPIRGGQKNPMNDRLWLHAEVAVLVGLAELGVAEALLGGLRSTIM